MKDSSGTIESLGWIILYAVVSFISRSWLRLSNALLMSKKTEAVSFLLSIAFRINMALLRAKTFARVKKMPVLQAMGRAEGWVKAILYCNPSLL